MLKFAAKSKYQQGRKRYHNFGLDIFLSKARESNFCGTQKVELKISRKALDKNI